MKEMSIHPTAIVNPKAQIASDVQIGPYSIIGPNVVLHAGVKLGSHVIIEGHTTLEENVTVGHHAALGGAPQSIAYKGEPGRLHVGPRTTIREYATLHIGSEKGGMETRLGSDCFLMIATHVAHDCKLGNHVQMNNQATLAGHVELGDHVILGGLSAVHQWTRIGKHAIIGGMSGVESDVIPYGSVMGDRAALAGLNLVGLKRRGFPRPVIHHLRTAYRLLFSPEGTMEERMNDVIEMFQEFEAVMEIVSFMRSDSQRGLCMPRTAK